MATGSDSEAVLCPVRVGAGSFAAVHVPRHGRVAYKDVHNATQSDVLPSEYRLLAKLYSNYNGLSMFSFPRAYAYCDGGNLTVDDAIPATATIMMRDAFKPFARATYAMDYIFPLPHASGAHLGAVYFPADLQQGPTLCRLYFGKAFPTTRPRFVSSSNFPLDEDRYEQLRAVNGALPTAAEVARAMGEMLARLHFLARIDARDVEFVLGGDGYFGHAFYIIDFNQVRPFDVSEGPVEPLVSAFFANDPYYPRPRAGNQLYTELKYTYLSTCPSDAHGLDVAFIQAIEASRERREADYDRSRVGLHNYYAVQYGTSTPAPDTLNLHAVLGTLLPWF